METAETVTVSDAAGVAANMIAAGEPLKNVWRYAIVQLLDDYRSVRGRDGVAGAAALFTRPPAPVGDVRVDAALAALAEYLARADGWTPPDWVRDPDRATPQWWFVTDWTGLQPKALVESPMSFRKRGVFITDDALARA